MNKYGSYTDILYSRRSILRGIARAFDLFGSFRIYNTSVTEQEADCKAIYSDWITVGNDLRNSIYEYERETRWR